jgi:hypothetical protein
LQPIIHGDDAAGVSDQAVNHLPVLFCPHCASESDDAIVGVALNAGLGQIYMPMQVGLQTGLQDSVCGCGIPARVGRSATGCEK